MTSILRFLALAACAAAAIAGAQRLDPRLSTAPTKIVPVDRIVAVVNDEVITQNELSERVALVVRQLQRQGGQLPAADALSRQILERMINDLLQVQLAKESGIKIDDPTLERTIERIAQENNLSMPEFRAALERDGIKYPRFRDDIRSEIMVARLREREVENNIVVTDAEVDTELAREARTVSSDSEYRLSHVLVLVPSRRRRAPTRSSRSAGAPCRPSRTFAAARTSRRSPRPTPTRPTRCRAATSDGGRRRGCPGSSSRRSSACRRTT